MLADETNSARLSALLARLLDECYLGADLQSVECSVDYGVAVKIDFAPVRRLYEAVISSRKEFCHPAAICLHMFLHLMAHVARDVLNLAHRRIESIPDCDERMLALGRVAMQLVNNDVIVLGHCDAKLNLEEAAAAAPGLRPNDDDVAARDARAELF